jgi:hypothetical protein
MNDYHRRLANTPRFREAATTMGIKSLARQYGVGREAIRDMLQLIGVEPVTLTAPNDDAPTPEEEAASLASLDLAPLVAARANIVFFGGVLDD